MSDGEKEPEWVSAGCTLPTSEQPLRVAEFDDLFRAALCAVDRPEQARLALAFAEGPGVEARLRGLIAREAQCCSFFTFAVTRRNGGLRVEVAVPYTHLDVLDEMAARARRVAGLET